MTARTRWALVGIALGIWAVLVFAMVTDAHAAGRLAASSPKLATDGTVGGLRGPGAVNDTPGILERLYERDSEGNQRSREAATPPVPPSVVATRDDPDQTGVRASAYTGKYYRAVDEGYRRCVAFREGRGQLWITGANGRYFGTYQMTGPLIRGAAWMMTDELREMWPDHWRLIRNTLLDTPGNLWSRFYSDMSFWTVLNWDHDRRGAFHWSGGRFSCWPGMTWSGGDR